MPNTFSKIVCSSQGVSEAFVGVRTLDLWWRIILFLHGKPGTSELPPSERIACIAQGFRFYAVLYAVIAAILIAAGVGLAVLTASVYGAGLCLITGILLAGITLFGADASQRYAADAPYGTVHLAVFVVFLMLFLTGFIATASVALALITSIPAWVNLTATFGLLVFGVGSYCIELLYLLTA